MNNVTLKVASLWHCDYVLSAMFSNLAYWDVPRDPIMSDPIWRQTATGCRILQLLQDMFKFNMTYLYQDVEANLTVYGKHGNVTFFHDDSMDINVRPMNCRPELLDQYYPLQPVYTWRLGFFLRRPDHVSFYRTFYSKPFTRPAWNCLYAMAFLFASMFYALKRWEKKTIGGKDCSLSYETLMVIGGYCQHIPPIDPVTPSRRIAYFIFFIFAYIVYTYYTSNLLSHLVNDTDHGLNLYTLAQSQYECLIVDYLKVAFQNSFASYNQNYSIMSNKLADITSVTVPEGMESVRAGRAAILSDYTSLYPFIKKALNNEEICKLVQIDLFSDIKKYIFTRKDFLYNEEFKVGVLRAKEAGILKRLITDRFLVPQCSENTVVQVEFIQISTPLLSLSCAYIVSLLILATERVHFKRNKVWPYVD